MRWQYIQIQQARQLNLFLAQNPGRQFTVFITDVTGRQIAKLDPIKVLGQHQLNIDLGLYNQGCITLCLFSKIGLF